MGKMGGYEDRRERLKKAGIEYGLPSPGFYEGREVKEAQSVEELKKIKHPKYGSVYLYNFKVKGNFRSVSDQERGFKELYEFIASRTGLDKELGLDQYEMKRLSEGKEVKTFSWEGLEDGENDVDYFKIMQLSSL
ncbi:hypothetical protein [Bacillus albus]|uniref:hypothetical protein n=1 Tax=Bacillus albus TaxID=2026189 RepID=UPI003D20AA4B